MAVHIFFTWACLPPKTFFLITKGGPLGIFNEKFFFACFVPSLLLDSLNKGKFSIFKSKQAKKVFLSKIPKGIRKNVYGATNTSDTNL